MTTHTIEIHSTPHCSACNFTKRAFTTKGVPYTEVQMTPEQAIQARDTYGATQAPLVLIKDADGVVVRQWSGMNAAAVLEVAEEFKQAASLTA